MPRECSDAILYSAGLIRPSGCPATWPASATIPANRDRKSTRLNSSHGYISYAVFCLKKKKPVYYHRQAALDASVRLHPYDAVAHLVVRAGVLLFPPILLLGITDLFLQPERHHTPFAP